MGKGIRSDLQKRFDFEHSTGKLVIPDSKQDSQRLIRAYRRGNLVRPAQCVYALPDYWETLDRRTQARSVIVTLASVHPDWVFCNASAALMHNLEVGYGQLGMIHLACSRKSHIHDTPPYKHHIIHEDTFEQIDKVNVTSLKRTAFDCMRESRFPRALAIADSALRLSGMSCEELCDAFRKYHGNHRNARRPIDIAPFADVRAENGGESVARATIIKLGYRLPELQVDIPNLIDQGETYRVDFYWELDTGSVAGELDGHDKYVDPRMTGGRNIVEVMAEERLRESHLSGSNIKIMRFSYNDVRNYKDFSHLLDAFHIPNGYPIPPISLT